MTIQSKIDNQFNKLDENRMKQKKSARPATNRVPTGHRKGDLGYKI